MSSRIRGKFNLAALKSVVRELPGKDKDKKVKCLIIPIEENNLFLSEKGAVYLDTIAFESDKIKEFTHSVKQSFSKKKMEELGLTNNDIPFLGNLEYISDGQVQNTQTASSVLEQTDSPMVTDVDDLPF